ALLVGLGDVGVLGGRRAAASIDSLDEAVVRSILERAVCAAAITCSREGADPPSREEVDRALSAG
ncbi:MAG: carbohydrate kinase, partial [Actinomycetota bacterium]